ncbi:AI-2E family transporter [Nitrospira sp. NS4]|uniref:AI-2E family transporter n=1 Tax=Nitrospira sp. NS4 TaxID=3414498 RepID=UPI003C2F0B8F
MPHQPERQTVSQTNRFAQVALMVGTLALAALLFSPFFSPILWAVVLVYALYPLYGRVLRATGGREALSAVLMCTVTTIGLLLPLFYLTLLVAQDLAGMVSSLVTYLQQGERSVGEGWRRYPVIAGFVAQFQNLERLTGSDLRSGLVTGVADLGKLLIEQSTNVVTNLVQRGIEFGIVLLSAFYFFRDGKHIVDWTQETLPITPERRLLVLTRFDEVVKGAVYGNTIVALLEGFIGWLAFWSVGLPSPILWGAVMAITAYIPFVGAALVWFPAAIYLAIQGAYMQSGALVAAGIVLSVVIDELVRNMIVGKASKLHSLIMFFSVLGGLRFFGLVGIVAGPLVVAMAVTFLEAYRNDQVAPVQTEMERPGEKS